MTNTELEEWTVDIFWPTYKKLCSTPFVTQWAGGVRGEAVQKITTLHPSEALRQKILDALHEQILHRKKLWESLGRSNRTFEEKTKFNKFYANRNAATWINQKGWNDEIPALSEVRQPKQDEINFGGDFVCRLCDNPVKIKLTLCESCEKKYKKRDYDFHMQNLKKMGIDVDGKLPSEIAEQCKCTAFTKRYLGMLNNAK